jgi:phage tail protein X
MVYQPNILGFELLTVQGDGITVDMLVWRRYRIPLAGTRLTEVLLDLNPHLSRLHRNSPFLPVGTQVRVPIDTGLLSGRPTPVQTVTLWGKV